MSHGSFTSRQRVYPHYMARVLVAFVVLAAVPHVPRAPQPAPETWRPKVEAWVAAVESHVPGRADAAATAIGRWLNSDISRVMPRIEALLELLTRPLGEPRIPPGLNDEDVQFLRDVAKRVERTMDRNQMIKRAAVLHADVMIFGLAKEARYLTADQARHEEREARRIVVLSKDGEPHGFAVTPRHWDFARWLLAEVLPSPADDPFVRQWYRSTTAHMFGNLRWDESEDQLDFARRTIGPDARLEFDTGCLYERLAAPSVTIVMDALHRTQPVGPVRSRAASLSRAEAAFKEAVRLDPGFVEARVRLGRVMTLRGRSEEALELLRPVEEGRADPIVRYFAALFLGDVHERAGRRDAAVAAYRHAAALYPDAQSPRLALSAIAIARGDRTGGIDALQRLLELPADEKRRHDPWWVYEIGTGRHSEALMEALWASVPKARAQ